MLYRVRSISDRSAPLTRLPGCWLEIGLNLTRYLIDLSEEVSNELDKSFTSLMLAHWCSAVKNQFLHIAARRDFPSACSLAALDN
jgi:hypothetical protein